MRVGVFRGQVVHFVDQVTNVALGGPTFQGNTRKGAIVSVFQAIGTHLGDLLERLQILGITADFLPSTRVTGSGDFGAFAWEGFPDKCVLVIHRQWVGESDQ